MADTSEATDPFLRATDTALIHATFDLHHQRLLEAEVAGRRDVESKETAAHHALRSTGLAEKEEVLKLLMALHRRQLLEQSRHRVPAGGDDEVDMETLDRMLAEVRLGSVPLPPSRAHGSGSRRAVPPSPAADPEPVQPSLGMTDVEMWAKLPGTPAPVRAEALRRQGEYHRRQAELLAYADRLDPDPID
jgi:hypothetical protein